MPCNCGGSRDTTAREPRVLNRRAREERQPPKTARRELRTGGPGTPEYYWHGPRKKAEAAEPDAEQQQA